MRKIITIATISFLTVSLISCSSGTGSGPTTLLKEEAPRADLSAEDLFNDAGKAVFTYHLGPYQLPARTSAGEMLAKPGGIHFRVEEPTWITSFEPSIEDADGNPLPNELVHHILLINHGEENTFCTTKQTGNPFAAATSNMEKIELPEGHGYPVIPADQLEAEVVLKNPTDQDYYGVFVKFIITGEEVDDAKIVTDVRPMMVDIDPCEHKPISIAPGQFVEKTKSVFAPEAGALVKAYGLLQNYGVSVTLTAGDQDEPFWNGVAEIDENYQIVGLPPFEDPAGIPVKRGEALNLTVTYNNCSDNWYDEAVGAAMVYLARTGEEEDQNGPPEELPEAEEVGAEAATNKSIPALSVQKELISP